MKYVKLFEGFNEKGIHGICKKYDIKNYTINPDGSIDVDGNIGLRNIGMISLPLKFNKVNGYFSCSVNNITTLEGSPNYVGMNFHCQDTSITTLKGAPSYIGGDFYCDNNMLTSLEYSPDYVRYDFICNYNRFTSLKYLSSIYEVNDSNISSSILFILTSSAVKKLSIVVIDILFFVS